MNKKAFTLAEVLITLGIIGVVAAMTLPMLITKHREKVTVNRLKKAYSIVSQAYQRAIADNDTLNNWNFTGDAATVASENGMNTQYNDDAYSSGELFLEKISQYMHNPTLCTREKILKGECEKSAEQHTLSGVVSSTAAGETWGYMILSDGTIVNQPWMSHVNCTTNYCGDFSIDINSNQAPNTVGKDRFYFIIYRDRIAPFGMPDDEFNRKFPAMCNLTNSYFANGYGCTAWVLSNENLDYLHCDDLAWNGKHKCK